MNHATILAAAVAAIIAAPAAQGADIKVLTAGAFKQVVVALVPQFEKRGNKVEVVNDTAGALKKRIEGGEAFDVAVVTPAVIDALAADGKIAAGSPVSLARVGIGVAVKDGAPRPDVSTVDAFKRTLLAAKSVAYIDPASGGSSGIYLAKLFERLGIADQLKPKSVLVHGGLVAERLITGEAELAVHQISEILPVKGVVLVGPLPAEIQNTTTYAAGISAATKQKDAAKAFIQLLSGPEGAAVLKSKGMEPYAS